MAERRERVGLVIAGAGARGAYEAGALAALLPRLEEVNMRPRVLVGTSAGSINAAYLAAKLHLGAEAATDGLKDLWRSLNKPELMGPLWRTALPALFGYGGRFFGLGTGAGSLASFGRFPEVLDAAVEDWKQIQANIETGVLDAVGMVATAASSGGSVVFMQHAAAVDLPGFDEGNGVRYVSAPLGSDHVVASSSIPVFFPPKKVVEPPEASGWYWDGGTRINTPIKPALAIGVDRLVIVATDPPRHPAPDSPDDAAKPDFDEAILHLVQATLNDPLIEDLHSLVRLNSLLSASGTDELDGRRRYPYMFAGPPNRGVLGQIAAQILREQFSGPLEVLSDFAIINRILGRQGPQEAELQSYLLFESDFIKQVIDLGQKAGEQAWRRSWLADELP
ncbi:MAG: patatin-like phospholipase family protein [Actinobacteria bacterium]|nr:patatin-like phospholipase family protein [Actinomycetota bacterium]